MNEERIKQALQTYDGTEESLHATIPVLAEELGANWTETVFQELGGLPVELKEKLNHAFNYYAALVAWQETQSYLEKTEALDESVKERLPVLKHWLDFFGDDGTNLYQQLEEKLNTPAASVATEANTQQTPSDVSTEKQADEEEEEEKKEASSVSAEIDNNSPEAFAIQKAKKEIALLDALQSWLSARCLQLNNMEVFAYPYYGLAVDLMRQTVQDIQAVLDLEDKTLLPQLYDGGEEALIRKKQAVEADIASAVENCESATTALIDENINMDDVRKTLGNLDESSEKEYLGPAPDGFELIQETDEPLDEAAVKEQYQKLEKEVLAQNSESEKNTSQKSQNSVQRKLSFSLKPKK